MTLEAELRDTERRRLAALVAADIDVAGPLHADDYELITPGGRRLTRDDYLDGIAAGDLHYLVFEPVSEIRVRLHDQVAILRYEVAIEIELEAGVDRDRFWHTDVYELRDGRWQAVWSHATRIRAG
jgi:hypothetical protein